MSKGKDKSPAKKEKKTKDTSGQNLTRLHPIGIFFITFLLYANTLTHDYTQDDAIVIYDNMFTQEGVSGIPGLLKYDTFYGFFKTEGKAKLVSGGRYRPLTPIMFAIEYQIFGKNPFYGHLISIILYALLCMLIYKTLLLLLANRFEDSEGFKIFAFLATALYAAHPLHTEVVANIKGRDEIMSMMGAILALYYCLKYIDLKKYKYLIFTALSMFLGLMAKENTITFMAVIPLAIHFFRSTGFNSLVKPTVYAFLGTSVFLAIRFSVLGFDLGGKPMELMNNPFIKIVDNSYVPLSGGEQFATIIYTLGKYLALLVWPHPLTHDYYPRHIEIMSFGNWKVILSFLVYIGLIVYALKGWKEKKIISFCIIYFIATLSIVSNIVFPIGTNMSERFMFMPSLGFVLALTYILYSVLRNRKQSMKVFIGSIGLILFLYFSKTTTRNMIWKNDFTLFTTDVKTSSNSAKVLNAAGGALLTDSNKPENAAKKSEMIQTAIPYLKKALEIHPNYKNAALLLGNAYYYNGEFENAIQAYERTLNIAPDFADANKNLAIAYRDAGRQAGEKENNLEKAKKYLNRSLQLVDTDPDTYRLLGITYGMSGEHPQAIKYFTKVTEMQPKIAAGYVNLAKAYQYYGDDESSRINYQKALEIDPNAMNK